MIADCLAEFLNVGTSKKCFDYIMLQVTASTPPSKRSYTSRSISCRVFWPCKDTNHVPLIQWHCNDITALHNFRHSHSSFGFCRPFNVRNEFSLHYTVYLLELLVYEAIEPRNFRKAKMLEYSRKLARLPHQYTFGIH